MNIWKSLHFQLTMNTEHVSILNLRVCVNYEIKYSLRIVEFDSTPTAPQHSKDAQDKNQLLLNWNYPEMMSLSPQFVRRNGEAVQRSTVYDIPM